MHLFYTMFSIGLFWVAVLAGIASIAHEVYLLRFEGCGEEGLKLSIPGLRTISSTSEMLRQMR